MPAVASTLALLACSLSYQLHKVPTFNQSPCNLVAFSTPAHTLHLLDKHMLSEPAVFTIMGCQASIMQHLQYEM